MKVKYLLKSDNNLKQDKEYNVFAVCMNSWLHSEPTYYISCSNDWYFSITPFDSSFFEITDNSISKYWEYWIDNNGCKWLWIKEFFTIDDFYYKYTESEKNDEIIQLLFIYYKLAKDDLFN